MQRPDMTNQDGEKSEDPEAIYEGVSDPMYDALTQLSDLLKALSEYGGSMLVTPVRDVIPKLAQAHVGAVQQLKELHRNSQGQLQEVLADGSLRSAQLSVLHSALTDLTNGATARRTRSGAKADPPADLAYATQVLAWYEQGGTLDAIPARP